MGLAILRLFLMALYDLKNTGKKSSDREKDETLKPLLAEKSPVHTCQKRHPEMSVKSDLKEDAETILSAKKTNLELDQT